MNLDLLCVHLSVEVYFLINAHGDLVISEGFYGIGFFFSASFTKNKDFI